jgi:putative ABC transport system permease protein
MFWSCNDGKVASSFIKIFTQMTLNQVKQVLRLLFKEKRITIINIIGLSISLACALFMLLWVQHELSYDRFHADFERIYRVEEDQYYSNAEPYHVNVTPFVSGPVWKDEVPEIEEQCRLAFRGGHLFTEGENKFFEDGIAVVDSSFFDMFTFLFKYGTKEDVLREPNTMVITEELATKYFGDDNPVGRTIQVNQEKPFTVSAVIEDPPSNSILGFKVLFPWNYLSLEDRNNDSWGSNSIMTVVKLQEGAVDSIVSRKITEVTNIYKENNTIDYMVAPFSRIHLHSYFGFGRSPGAILYVYIFGAIAFFVLLIACINFMNLATARSSIRAKEIGLRKVNGASRWQLVQQYLTESFVQTLISVLLAFLLVLALLNQFNHISGKDIEPAGLFSSQFLLGILAVLVLTTLLAGSYPALYLSALRPIRAIREQNDQRTGSGLLRKILVVFQFTLAVILITGAMVATRQLTYMRNADLGYNKNNLVHIPLRGNLNQEYETLKQSFMENPGVLNATASMQPPYRIGSNSSGINWEGKDPELEVLVSFTGVHYDFVETMGITLQGGRDFSDSYPSDIYNSDTLANWIINKTLANIIGKEDIVGMDLTFMGIHGQIVGVMEDYHFKPLGDEIEPMALAPLPLDMLMHMVVRLDDKQPEEALAFMKETWEEMLPQYPFDYTYVDEAIDNMYRGEERMSILLKIFTVVAMIIASLGLFALASFTAQRRTKEIGIRKSMGAMQHQITLMMIRDFSLYVLISLVIALPAVWFIANRWLKEFSFRIELKADLFIITALATTIVAILTVLYHAFRSARTNPVLALRYE